MTPDEAVTRIAALPCWSGKVDLQPLPGGMTNRNYVVNDRSQRFVVRLGDDIPLHGILRFNERAASRAAHAAGVSPPVVYADHGVMVLQYIEGKTYTAADIRDPSNLPRVIDLLKRTHHDIAHYLEGPVLIFWVFHILRGYISNLRQSQSPRGSLLLSLVPRAAKLEAAVGDMPLVFSHNDLLAANFLDDGKRLWLIDWDYAGYNSPLFDLGGLASNNEFDDRLTETLLEGYFGRLDDEMRNRFHAMKCASLLRETMWSIMSELYSTIDFDYVSYTDENLKRFENAYTEWMQRLSS
ncbi:MAG: phosphotransferase [Pseudomonadota bacterium]|nr:phosphotransferase [Pseudomonadota bacterium]